MNLRKMIKRTKRIRARRIRCMKRMLKLENELADLLDCGGGRR